MQTTELSQQNIAAAAGTVPENTPFVMLNLLRYNKEADYGDRTEFGRCSGREAYFHRYVPAFAQVAALSNKCKRLQTGFPRLRARPFGGT